MPKPPPPSHTSSMLVANLNSNPATKRTIQRQRILPSPLQVFTQLLSIICLWLAFYAHSVDAQALNDPTTQYIEGRLGNRRIWWCPSGYGYLAYCPQPTDWDNYNWCCTFPYMGSWKPSCCAFAIPTGAVIAFIIASVILLAVLIGMSCWCCYFCPLYKQLYESDDDDLPPPRLTHEFEGTEAER